MKATELMIGDWVLDKAVSDKPVQIEQINEQNVHYKRGNGYMSAGVELLEPIPLTHTIMENNGIKYQWGMPWFQGGFDGVFELHYNDGDSVNDTTMNISVSIRYVHELQQAIRLCKLSKEIEL